MLLKILSTNQLNSQMMLTKMLSKHQQIYALRSTTKQTIQNQNNIFSKLMIIL